MFDILAFVIVITLIEILKQKHHWNDGYGDNDHGKDKAINANDDNQDGDRLQIHWL